MTDEPKIKGEDIKVEKRDAFNVDETLIKAAEEAKEVIEKEEQENGTATRQTSSS